MQISVKNLVGFGERPPLNVMAPAFSMASVQISQHLEQTKWLPRNFDIFMASECSENTFAHSL